MRNKDSPSVCICVFASRDEMKEPCACVSVYLYVSLCQKIKCWSHVRRQRPSSTVNTLIICMYVCLYVCGFVW